MESKIFLFIGNNEGEDKEATELLKKYGITVQILFSPKDEETPALLDGFTEYSGLKEIKRYVSNKTLQFTQWDKFLRLKTDSNNSTKKEIEDMHLNAIERSDFLYVVCPGGYVGNSVIFEMGYAYGKNIPIYSSDLPKDIIIGEYVKFVLPPRDLCKILKSKQ